MKRLVCLVILHDELFVCILLCLYSYNLKQLLLLALLYLIPTTCQTLMLYIYLLSPILSNTYRIGGFIDEETGLDRSEPTILGHAGWI